MALSKTITASKSKQVRRQKSLAGKTGVGDDPHCVVGGTGSGSTQYIGRSLMDFNWNAAWADVKSIVKIELAIKTCTVSTHFSYGGSPRVRVERLTQFWNEGSGGEGAWSAGQYEWPASNAGGAVEIDIPKDPKTGLAQGENWIFIDVTNALAAVVPKAVLMPSGVAGGGAVDYGLLLRLPTTELNQNQRCIFYSFDNTGSGNDPYLKLTYNPKNRPPNPPTLTGPGVTNVTFADSFEGDHSDPDLDPMSARIIQVWPAGVSTGSPVWTLPANLQTAGSDEAATNHFSVPLSLALGSLKLQTNYEWVAQTRDPSGAWGAFSPRRALRITSSAPSVVASNVVSVSALAQARFGGTYSDPENNLLTRFQLQMRTQAAHNDAAFSDPNPLVWDTGIELPNQTEVTTKLIKRQYGGQALAAGNYTYRIAVQDSTGVWSAWSYDDWALTVPYDPTPGAIDLTTQVARNAPIRIALYKMGPKRGPGALIGHIDDPVELGASAYLNGAGEIYFSLPALHPYCPYVEPRVTHYAIEQWYGDRYRVLPEFSGLITDFDADPETATFYGTNYLGLLMTAVDERYDPTKGADIAAPTGSKYTNQTVDYVIRDQLTYHKGVANGPVGFINIGPLSAIAERVTIYSTYSEALPFITGLIDSHKQGTGKEARFYCRPVATAGNTTLAAAAAIGATNIKVASVANFAVGDVFSLGDNDVHQITTVGTAGAGGTGITFTGGLVSPHLVGEAVIEVAWEWALVDSWGHDRPNIALEYGSLLNDFRVVALGDFATRVLAVGQKRGEVQVYRAVGGQPPGMATGGLDESIWGRTAKTAFFPDIVDLNDLQRRANENAAQLSKIGKRMALAIEADVLAPFDGYDLGDSIVINIVRGVVDTSRYGSQGLWTIYGLEWRYHPDGHTDLNLTVLPKKSLISPPADLIPSVNPGVGKEWQVGYGKPTIYGNKPVPSHP